VRLRKSLADLAVAAALAAATVLPESGHAAPVGPAAPVERAQAVQPDREARLRVQDALVWTGHYDGRLDGAFGPRTRQAIRNFQASMGDPATGSLSQRQVASLEAARQEAVAAAGFSVVEDLETGVRIGIPTALFERTGRDGRTVVYGARPGQPGGSLALISFPGDRDDLAELYRMLTGADVVEEDAYAVLKDGWFVVSDEKGGTVTYTYVEAADGALKGFTLGWPDHLMDVFAPVATAMYNSFEPIPGYVLD
jgi:peptidoglycan hydrolase-like protein with peptidoglycan-binding domain